MDKNKPGYKTTEFWASLSTSTMGILVTLGVFTPDQANTLVQSVTAVAGAIIAALPVLGYALSRGKAKGGQ